MAKKGGTKQKKMNARVDFTPMVDMIMLLVTFFMLCTTLLKPQTMEITMPSDKEDQQDDQRSQAKASEAITILIDGDDAIYYFEGTPSADKLKKTVYGKTGIRAELMRKNAVAQQKVAALDKKYETIEVNEQTKEQYKKELSEIKNGKGTPTVIIKASDKATYKNMIDVLDEMQICTIGKYVIDNFTDADQTLIDGYKGGAAQ